MNYELSYGFVADTINKPGLSNAIREIANDSMEMNCFVARYSTSGFVDHESGSKFQLNIFSIIQEPLNNIIKYAKATLITIRLTQTRKGIWLKFTDRMKHPIYPDLLAACEMFRYSRIIRLSFHSIQYLHSSN